MLRFSSLHLPLLCPALGLLALAALSATPAHAQDLFVTNNGSGNTVERITPAGTGSVFATGFNGPTGIAFNSAGDLFVANNGSTGTIIKYAAGSKTGQVYYTQANAGFQGLTFDSAGNLYAASAANNTVLKITAANTGSTFYSGTGTTALNAPNSLAFDKSGNLYVGNTAATGANADAIVKITAAGVFSTFSTGIVVAYGLAFDSAGNLYAANGGNSNVLKYTTDGGAGSVFATGLNNPHGAAFDGAGNLYVANTSASPATIAKITATGVVSVFDSAATDSSLISPRGLAFSPTPAAAPEPSSLTTVAFAALGLGALLIKARKRAAATP